VQVLSAIGGLAVSSPSDRNDLRSSRQPKSSQFIVLFLGIVFFAVATGGLMHALQPLTLRIAVGPPGSEDEKLVATTAKIFADGRAIRLVPVAADGSIGSLALLKDSKADLAIARADLTMPANAETVAIVRKDFVVLWVPSKGPENADKRRRAASIKEIAGLNEHRVGLIGDAPENVDLLKIILSGSGVEPEKVAVKQFAANQISDLAGDTTIDAVMVVQPLDSKIISEAINATTAAKGEPKFLAIEASEAIAMKHPHYASEEIPFGVFDSSPARPNDKVETMSVDHLIVARKNLSEATVASFARQLFAIRQSLARQTEGAAHLQKPDTDKDAELPVHRGAAAFIEGNERTFLDKYGDYFWFSLLGLSGLGSAIAWLRHFLKRDERTDTALHRNQILSMVPKVRIANSAKDLAAMQREVNSIILEAVRCYDDGALEEGDITTFGLVLELFHHAIAERSAELDTEKRCAASAATDSG
jgi:TRAP-type uncharacterized transport system substrate-binding protein